MRHSQKFWKEALLFWEYSLCSDKVDDKYNPLGHSFLRNQLPIKIMEFEIDNDYGYASLEKDKLVINFQGSDDFKDWINNLRGLKLLNREDVHDGFYFSAKKFRDKITNVVREYIKITGIQNPNIVCCGGSRGGSLAKEAARYISKHLSCPTVTFTYGSPRVGGMAYYNEVKDLSMTVFNLVNAGDPVPNLPPLRAGFVNDPVRITVDRKWWYKFMPWMWKKVHLGYGKTIKAKIKGGK